MSQTVLKFNIGGVEYGDKIGAALIPRERGPDLIRPQMIPEVGANIRTVNCDGE